MGANVSNPLIKGQHGLLRPVYNNEWKKDMCTHLAKGGVTVMKLGGVARRCLASALYGRMPIFTGCPCAGRSCRYLHRAIYVYVYVNIYVYLKTSMQYMCISTT